MPTREIPVSQATRTVIASALLAGSGLVLWLEAPVIPVLIGCAAAIAISIWRERRGSE